MELIKSLSELFRPVLSDRTILKYNKKGLLIEGELKESQIQPNSIDLTLGDTWKTLKPNWSYDNKDIINPKKEVLYKEGTFMKRKIELPEDDNDIVIPEQCYILKPKQFCLMASKEVLNIPNGVIAFVQGRSSIARLAVQTEQAGLIDAGFRGTITFEVFNQSDYPIILYPGMRIAQVYFFKAQYADKLYGSEKGSKYNGQIEATGSKVYLDPELNK